MNKSWNACEINKQHLHEPIKHCARCHRNPTVEQHGKNDSIWTITCDACDEWVHSVTGLDFAIRAWNLQQRTQA